MQHFHILSPFFPRPVFDPGSQHDSRLMTGAKFMPIQPLSIRARPWPWVQLKHTIATMLPETRLCLPAQVIGTHCPRRLIFLPGSDLTTAGAPQACIPFAATRIHVYTQGTGSGFLSKAAIPFSLQPATCHDNTMAANQHKLMLDNRPSCAAQ